MVFDYAKITRSRLMGSMGLIIRYEEDENGGAFYVGDDDETCVSQDMFVNAWMNLPAPYKPKGE